MKINLDEREVCMAIVEWLKNKHEIEIEIGDLTPTIDHGRHDDISEFIGFEFERP